MHHHFKSFHCNYCDPQDGTACKEKLEEGWLTACSHLFCHKHARSWFGNRDDCPICRVGPVKLVRMDMSEAALKHRGRHALTGMTPPEIIRAAETALTFWSDQRVFEFRREGERQHKDTIRLKSMEDKARERLQEAEAACNTLEADNSHLQQSLSNTNLEVEKLSRELEGLRQQAARLEASFRASPHGNAFVGSSQRSLLRSPVGSEYAASPASQKWPDRRLRPDLQSHPSQPHRESQNRSRMQTNFGDLDSIAEASQRIMPERSIFPASSSIPATSAPSLNSSWLGGAQPRQGYHGLQSRYPTARRSVSNPRSNGPYANVRTPPHRR
eukprot:TRINITY_DN33183_c0_g1_i1.p1 TRINITY_DN33183_c0_g1~~TRINITY_DN33183_c0_g1_i1.p1  ORF type:complete len:356 (-),score=40.88 TRINITY_DN33183_c0_g1_i1:329-1312(-)